LAPNMKKHATDIFLNIAHLALNKLHYLVKHRSIISAVYNNMAMSEMSKQLFPNHKFGFISSQKNFTVIPI